jgi:flagellar protein FlbD
VIQLTRLNGEAFILNAELIQYVESRPDTYVTLTTSDRFIVRESMEEVVRRAVEYSRTIRQLGVR